MPPLFAYVSVTRLSGYRLALKYVALGCRVTTRIRPIEGTICLRGRVLHSGVSHRQVPYSRVCLALERS